MSETKAIDKWMEKHVLWKYEGDEKEVIIPSHINIIAHDAFNGSTVESVIIPDSVGIIGVNSFANCPNLKSVTVPESVDFIRNGAFSNCKKLKNVTFPKTLREVGKDIFKGCKALKKIPTVTVTFETE